MKNFLSFEQFLNESNSQSDTGKDFEDLIGGILKGSKIIKDVVIDGKVLNVIPNGKLGKIDLALIMGLLQDQSNLDKLRKEFKGIKAIQLDKITLDV
jgi:hypothetical protein